MDVVSRSKNGCVISVLVSNSLDLERARFGTVWRCVRVRAQVCAGGAGIGRSKS